MAKREVDFSEVGYVLGISSIILAFFQPIAGFIFGVVGFMHSKKQKNPLSDKARRFNIIGMVLSVALFVTTLFITAKYSGLI